MALFYCIAHFLLWVAESIRQHLQHCRFWKLSIWQKCPLRAQGSWHSLLALASRWSNLGGLFLLLHFPLISSSISSSRLWHGSYWYGGSNNWNEVTQIDRMDPKKRSRHGDSKFALVTNWWPFLDENLGVRFSWVKKGIDHKQCR